MKKAIMLALSFALISSILFVTPGNNVTATACAYVRVCNPRPSISLTKTPSATCVLNGTSVSYLFNATNTGHTDLTGAIYDSALGHIGSFVNMAPGGWVAFNVSHVLTHSTYNVATAYGVDQYGNNVTATASAYVKVYNQWEHFSWYHHFSWRHHFRARC